MKDEEINKRFAKHDEDVQAFILRKFRGMKKPLSLFTWAGKHPWQAILILFIFIGISFFVYFSAVLLITGIDVRKTIENKTEIEFRK